MSPHPPCPPTPHLLDSSLPIGDPYLELSVLFVLMMALTLLGAPIVLALAGASSGDICATCRKIMPMPEL